MASFDNQIETILFLIFGGGSQLYSGLKRVRQARAVDDTARCELCSAAQGLAIIDGHALPYAGSFANLGGKACAYRELRIERRESKNHWETLYAETEGDRFVVSDGTGLAVVLAAGAEFTLEEKCMAWSGFSEEERFELHARYGAKVEGLSVGGADFFNLQRKIRLRECSIVVGAPVCIRGNFVTREKRPPYAVSPHNLQFLGKLARLRAEPRGAAKAFDLNRDGTVEEHELLRGSEKLYYQSKSGILPEDRPEPVAVQGVFMHDPVHGLLIGGTHKTYFHRRLSNGNALRIFGGIAMIAAGIGVLVGAF